MCITILVVYDRNWSEFQPLASPAVRTYICLYIDGNDRGGGLVLADTGEVKEDKEKKDFDIETMKDDFLAVETIKTVLMGLAMLMCTVVIQVTF